MLNITLICFDLDGVIIDSRETHFLSLNKALGEVDEKYIISHKDHLTKFDGLPTNKKLNILSDERNLPLSEHINICKRKQELLLKI